jgi:hypothetical protein
MKLYVSLYKESTFESQFKLDCLSSAILAQVSLSGNPFLLFLEHALQVSWSLWSIPFV